MEKETAPLVWIDLEATHLEYDKTQIVEIAMIITDSNLNTLAESPAIVIHHDENTLENMSAWCIKHFEESGLTDRVRKSTTSVTQAEDALMKLLEAHTEPGLSPLCGNSVHFDRWLVQKFMPHVAKHLNYRSIDVTSLKELARRWKPDVVAMVQKENEHLALADIKESIEELKVYREHFLKL